MTSPSSPKRHRLDDAPGDDELDRARTARPEDLDAIVLDRLVTFVERTSDLIGVTDDRGAVIYLNRAARVRLGLPAVTDAPITTADLFPPESFDIYFDQIRPRIIGGDVWTGYLPIRGAVEELEMWATVVGETRPGGEVAWVVLAARDLNDWRHIPEGYQRHASHDDLTGLASRSLLLDHLAKAQSRAARTGNAVAVAFIDLDDMKTINLGFGTSSGDAVLVEVARRLRDAVRVIDTVARVGGDQFVILFDGVSDEDEATVLTTQIQAHLESAAFDIAGTSVNVSASIGIAVARDGEPGDQLLGRADTAMYEVKAERRHRSGRAAPTVGPDLRSITLKDLAVAVTRHDIVPFYQRVVGATDGVTCGVQALARWLRPAGPAVDAAQFLTIADGSGISFSLDLAILRDAAAELAGRPELGCLYVPVGSRFLRHPGIDRFVREVLTRAGLAPERLAILVPDHLAVARGLVVGEAISALRDLGVRLVLDTWPPTTSPRPSSELARPNRSSSEAGPAPESLDVDRLADVHSVFGEVRLSPAWIPLLERAPEMVAAAVERARSHGQQVLVGGVETDEQRRQLVTLGCDRLSGHLFASPVAVPA